MTENKRFTIQGVGISDHERKRLYDLETVDGFISVRDLLNELNDENEQLKQQLQSRINDYDVALKTLQDLTERKLKENEKLKSEIKDLNDVLARYEEKHQEECIYEYMKLIGEDTLNEMNKSK